MVKWTYDLLKLLDRAKNFFSRENIFKKNKKKRLWYIGTFFLEGHFPSEESCACDWIGGPVQKQQKRAKNQVCT